MSRFVRTTVQGPLSRRLLRPAFAVAALALSAQAAFAVGDGGQVKPQIKVEAERTPQGARITLNGKGWAPAARIKVTATRAPGSSSPQDFGMFSADSAGVFQGRKVAGCTTSEQDVATEPVTFTAADSATGTKVTARVDGAAWRCM
jgi:hypothetical protein